MVSYREIKERSWRSVEEVKMATTTTAPSLGSQMKPGYGLFLIFRKLCMFNQSMMLRFRLRFFRDKCWNEAGTVFYMRYRFSQRVDISLKKRSVVYDLEYSSRFHGFKLYYPDIDFCVLELHHKFPTVSRLRNAALSIRICVSIIKCLRRWSKVTRAYHKF